MSTPQAASGMVMDRGSRLWTRPEANDQFIVDEVRAVYDRIPVRRDDVVLDLGAHIGAASHLLLARGAARAIAVEADPGSLEVLRRNLAGLPAQIIAAAVGPHAGQTILAADPRRPYLSTIMGREPGRVETSVPMVAFAALLAEHRPTIVKCDIEFAELTLIELYQLPAQVRVLAMEIHVRRDLVFSELRDTPDELRRTRSHAVDLIRGIEAQGFRCVRRKDKQAKGNELAIRDATGLPPMTKSIDAIWVRP